MTVPKLRFKDDNGNDYPAWEEKKIKDIAPLQRGFDLPTQKLHNGNYPVVYSNGIGAFHSQYKCVGEAVITGRSGTIGNVIYLPNCKYWPHNTTLWVTDFCNNYPKFVYYLFTQIDLSRFSSGSGVPTLNRNDIHSFKVCIPSLPEQKKIADFFSSFDKRIETTQKKLATLEKLKKGFMQKIFSQQLRFKDDNGNDYPAWEEKKLGDVCSKIGSGKTPKGGQKIYQDFGILLIRSQNVQDGALKLDDAVYISEKINDSMKNTEVHFNDILLNITGASIGRCCIYEKNIKANVNQHVCIIRIKSQNSKFLLFELLSNLIQNQIDRVQSGGSKQGLNFQQISNFFVLLPSLPEQKKIADFLSAFDEKMNLVRKEVDTLQTIKKGLLQQMFV